MADPLYELVEPHFDATKQIPEANSPITSNYLHRLTSLSLSSLSYTEPEALNHDSQSLLRSLQALSKRSYKSIDTSVEALSTLHNDIPQVAHDAAALQEALPGLESNALQFAEKYSKLTDNTVLDRRKRVLRLGDNVDRLSDILEMPALLSAIIAASSGSGPASTAGAMSSANANYASALDLYAHIRRLHKIYPDSGLVQSIVAQSEEAMRTMTTNLITSLRSQSLKLAGAMRLIGLLRRVAPDLDSLSNSSKAWSSGASEGSLGVVFLMCRLSTLTATLEALEPLRELADQESGQDRKANEANAWAMGQQTERYLKRYIEVFREQCFAIVSMYKSVFPDSLPGPSMAAPQNDPVSNTRPLTTRSASGLRDEGIDLPDDPMQNLPAALSTFTFHIVDLLMDTLRKYMPNIRDQGSRDSLLTQVLYCAASLGRLGGDFGMMLSTLEDEMDSQNIQSNGGGANEEDAASKDPEWVQIIKKHRVQAGRLELLASSAGRQGSSRELASPG